MVIVVTDCVGNMKGSDEKININLSFWNPIFQKMGLLLDRIEKFKGPEMSIDDTEYRWVNDRIEYFNSEERILTQDEMRVANNLWLQYK